jgi:nucleoside-diphosphate-sugar epimerase
MRKILLTGATGFLGSYTARVLLNAGLEVHAIKRESSSLEMVQDIQDQIHWHTHDLCDYVDMESSIEGMNGIIHCAALVSFDPKDKPKLIQYNIEATRDIINLALIYGIKKLVFVSSIAALGRYTQAEKVIDEKIEWSDGLEHTFYGISKHLAEQEVWRGQAEGLDTVIINPSLIMGAGQWTKGSPAIYKRVYGYNPFYPTGSTGVVDVRDVAEILYKALISDLAGERIIASGQNLTYKSILTTVAEALDKQSPTIQLSGLLLNALSGLDYLRATVLRQPRLVTKENLKASARTSAYSNEKSIRLLGHRYRSIEASIKETADTYLQSLSSGYDYGILPIN